MNTFAPVVKELKFAYDAARQQDETDLSDGEIDENVQPQANDSSSGPREPSEALVDDLVQEVTEIELTDEALPEKIFFLRFGQYFGFGAKRAGPKQKEGKNQKTSELQTPASHQGQFRNLGCSPKNHAKYGCEVPEATRSFSKRPYSNYPTCWYCWIISWQRFPSANYTRGTLGKDCHRLFYSSCLQTMT